MALAAVARAQTCVSPPPGLVSWWAGDGDGSDSITNNPGTLQNGLGFASGEVGPAFSFDGISNYFAVPASPTLNVATSGGFTLECWIFPTDLSQQHDVAEWNDGAGNVGTQLYISIQALGGIGSIFANLSDTSGVDHYLASNPNLLNTTTFQHIALTYDESTGVGKIFYNGTVVASQSLGSFTPQTSYGFYLGARVSGVGTGSYFQGLMDEVSLYNRALNDSEIQAIYSAGSAGKCKSTAPTIALQPTDRRIREGYQASFRVGAGGSGLSYQWHFNTADIPGATNATLLLTNVQIAQAGVYSVTVTNLYGSIVSSNATLSVDDSCINAAPGIISWWPAENNGTDRISGNNGTLVGGAGFAPGESGQAFNFDGTSGYVSIPADSTLDVGAGTGFTFECWIEPTNVSSAHAIAEWDSAGGIGSHLWFSVNGYGGPGSLFANIRDQNGGDHILTSAQNLITSNFQHVAVTYNRTNGVAKLYRNGAVVASQSIGSVRAQTTFPFFLGARVTGAGPANLYQGLIDEAALYDHALTDSEILAIYSAGSLGKTCVVPQIVTQPQSVRVKPGTNLTFAVTALGGTLAYQWRFQGSPLAAATNSSLSLTNVQPGNAGNYSVLITNGLGSALSSNALLKVDVVTAFGNGQPLTNAQASFANAVTISLQNAYTNGDIFYTLDGSPPTFASTQYAGAFVITQNVILRALGYSADFFESGELDPVAITLPPIYALTASSGGGGAVSLNPPGGSYLSNTVVALTATPASGWTFLQWIGDTTGGNPSTNVTVNRNKSVKAVFGTTLSTTAAGGGSVTLNPSGGVYPYGTVVWLSAIPQSGSVFAFWGNAASGNVNPLSFGITNPNPTVSSLFGAVSSGQAALTVIPIGNGRVAVNPRANSYTLNSVVSVTATPDAGRSFAGWSGDATGTQNPLSLGMNQNKTIYANFTHAPTLSVTASFEGLKPEGFILTLRGDYGAHYEIDGSTSLTSWTSLGMLTNSFGTIQWLDPSASSLTGRFYRAVLLP
jgi:hypothetical protein